MSIQSFCFSCLLLLICGIPSSNAQSWVWGRGTGGNLDDDAQCVATDSYGNVYTVGHFNSSSIIFGSTTLTNAGINKGDVFIAKYNSTGTILWAKRAGGVNIDEAYAVTIDPIGNVYVAGWFLSTTITFGTTTLTAAGNADIFLVKYDSAGNVLWAQSTGGVYAERINSITTDAFGNLYITGSFASPSITLGSTVLVNAGSVGIPRNDVFIAKYNPAGSVLWAKRAGGTDFDESNSIKTDLSGNVYITGSFRSPSITFASTTLINSGGAYSNAFIVKYDSLGNAIWAKSIGGAGDNQTYSVVVDSIGEVFITGHYWSATLNLGTTTLTNTNSGTHDVFLAKYSATGGLIWAKNFSGTSNDYSYSLANAGAFDVFFTGYYFSDSISFDTFTIYRTGVANTFLTKVDSSGNIISVANGGGGAQSMAMDDFGNVYIAGSFSDPSIIYASDTILSTGDADVFIAKYHDHSIPTLNIPEKEAMNMILVYPNPTKNELNITGLSQNTQYRLIGIAGNIFSEGNLHSGDNMIFMKNCPTGIYLLEIINSKGEKSIFKVVRE